MAFDNKGILASSGSVNKELLKELNELFNVQHLSFNISLSWEWLDKQFIPIINKYNISIPDKLKTLCDFISSQVVKALNLKQHTQQLSSKVLVTGGGAYNDFLIKCIKHKTKNKIIIPDNYTVEFKEALIFAFLGVLRIRNEVNCLSSVTGALRDNIGGAIY